MACMLLVANGWCTGEWRCCHDKIETMHDTRNERDEKMNEQLQAQALDNLAFVYGDGVKCDELAVREMVKACVAAGCTWTSIGKVVGLSPMTSWRKWHEFTKKGSKKKDIDMETVIEYHDDGMSWTDIAAEMGVSRATLYRRLSERNVDVSDEETRDESDS